MSTTHPHPNRDLSPARFQGGDDDGGGRSLSRAVGAGFVLVALIVGVPALAVVLDAVPSRPTSLPTREDLTGAIGAEQLVTVLVWVAAIAWLQFTICVIVELSSAIRGIGLPSRVPLSGPSQRLARALVGSVLLVATAAGQANAVAPTITGPPQHQEVPVTASVTHEADRSPTSAGAVVSADAPAPSGDVTYYLGDEVIDDDDAARLVGHKVYRVQPPEGRYHDNLWDIAERHLGDGRRYQEIFELNKARVQPDGHELSLARLIYPNWLLVMPADATGVGRVTAVEETPQVAATSAEQTADQVSETQPAAAQSADGAAGAAQDRPAAEHGESESSAALIDEVVSGPGALVGGGLLAAGLLAAIETVRRRRRTPEPSDDAVEVEVALRIGADPDRAAWLDHSLRVLSASCQAENLSLPSVYAATVDNDRIELLVAPASAEAPAPWTALDEGRRWQLNRQDAGAAAVSATALAPFPGLVSLGRDTSERDVLVDLEAASGPICVMGDPGASYEVVTALAAELATNGWSDHLRVTASGLPEELTALDDARYRAVSDLRQVLPELEARHADRLGGDVLTGRIRSGGAGAWMPEYVVMGTAPAADVGDELARLTSTSQRSPLGVLSAGDMPGARWRFSVDAAGNLDVPILGLSVRANRLSRASAAAVAAMIDPEGNDHTASNLYEAWLPEVRPEVPEAAAPVDEAALATAPVRVFVLGPAEVQSEGAIDDARRDLATEIVVYLALHRDGVHPTVLSGAIWPGGVTASVREATIARVRDWLGVDPEGSPYLLATEDNRLRLSDDVVLDWDVVTLLLKRARETRNQSEEFELLRRALRVARGPVLSSRPRGRYAWIARARLERVASDVLVDAAHRLSVLCLESGEAGTAAAAARAGLRVRPSEQLLWRDLLSAEHARMGHDAVMAVTNELTDTLGGIGVADLDPETMALLDELLPQPPDLPAAAQAWQTKPVIR